MATQNKPAADARALAARVLVDVLVAGRSLGDVLPPAQAALDDPRAGALVQELCYGTLRWYFRLDAVLQALLSKPLKSRDADVRCLLLTGLYQIDQLALPQRVAVHETVQAVRALDKDWAAGLVNAVLRNFQRRGDSLLQSACAGDVALHAHPAWLIERLRSDWPQDWAMILAANNTRPPFTLRVNRQRLTRDEYLDVLSQHALKAAAVPYSAQAVRLERPVPVSALPGFMRGDVSVQDAAAQLAAGLLGLAPGQRVLDACAAPGGKTSHILETEPAVSLVAVDIDATRLQRIESNLARLSLQAELLAGDAGQPDKWWDGHLFDRILLDVPCSGSGVIRRHPDIKVLRRAGDIDALVDRQVTILDAIWPLLAPGGMLLYCTCSVLKAENSGQLVDFLARHADAEEVPIAAAWGRGCTHGRQIFPGENQMDGFYFACVRKNS
ncbi:MAG TPA: 16S rRNA (cytosine(967)-C(5))-methyltransferase RsmB [Gammaproteobacteria bacterium]|nr:16S rRNA (cytosine(967)-C(5))-methyltransferase RsmB [Gammaproteobacteria bacterium]